ncbi:relaxin receptor 1 isoform X4 [Lagopus leucura]|uniref:relaxin receptor 1 isoform X4 n=1 Tax=Lagopus leucura TaxID=30410 RepID=UPI001C66A210|nr:relaxin receptor 1 isoform X4 [Lagopus leucura]
MTSDWCVYIFLLIGTKVVRDTLEDPVSRGSAACPLGYFPCGNITKCLPQQLHCNGEDDCGNHADEDNCEDNNGWSLQFDKHYAKRKYNKVKSLYAFQTRTSECLAGAVPAECTCQGLEVSCDAAQLRAIPLVPSNITMMSLQKNLLRKLYADVFRKYQDLKNLYLQDNKIRAVSKHAFKGLYNLTKLYLSNNKITNLKPHVFEDLHKLEWLIIENNRINRISPSTFYGLKSLILLEMMNNSLAHLPDKPLCQYMPRLNWLDLEGNHIHHLRNVTFISCSSLTVLVMRQNKIRSLNENSFSSLQMLDELDLASNEIESLPAYVFKDLKELSQLNLSYNPIKKIQMDQFDFLTKLKSLYFKKFQYCGYAPHVRSCKPNTDGISSLENLLASIIQRVFVWVVSAITCFGNIFVICMRPYIRSENKLHGISIMSLCCADCLMGIYLFVIGAFDLKYRGEYNKHAQLWMDSIHCQLVGSLAILSTEVSVLLLTYLTLEKYICIVYPFRCLKPRKCRTISILVLIWIIGFVVAFIPLSNKEFFRNYYGTNGVCFPLHSEQSESSGSQIYSVVIFLGVNLAAFLIIVFSYGSMFYSVHQTAIMATEIQNHIKKEMTLAKRFFFIVFTDALCWIPIFILKLLSLLQVEIPGTITSWVVIFILPINSALNPLLYTLTTRPFKEMIHQFWYNYRQRRSKRGKGSQKAYGPSFIWVEMWPTHEITPKLTNPVLCTDSSDASVTTQSTRLNSYT